MHRFFIFPPDEIVKNNVIISSQELVHQFVNVLRFKTGEKIMVLDNSGLEYLVEIEKISAQQVEGRILSKTENEAEPKLKIVLFFALTKSQDKVEWVLQKGTETGVSEFVPLITERTERESLSKPDRLRRILKEASEQSGRGIIPGLREPVKLKNVFDGKPVDEVNILAHPEANITLKDLFGRIGALRKINIYIGPEGGFSKQEIEKAANSGFFVFGLGKRILRAETAAILVPALTIFQNE